ncbi:phosphatidylinositol-specific phospholipase C/glycerophosphodiester phosphodiesterase family protein [Streptomyces sp. NPDC002659]|uniref:phosphatidylinositol-specific phospholipase C/glycerophosphodiester phosphodiesterase family protein n=1 Tax=Streptomyces sp. NPDC002659 TaxID=3364656 RepID=UPI00369977C1
MVLTTRRRAVTTIAAALAATVAAPAYAQAAQQHGGQTRPRPLRRAHAHNDYLHQRPLHDALSHGFTSVEADIFLVDGELLVAHEPADLDPTRTLRSLYLDPLLARVKANHGSVYRGYHRPVQLLIDIKTDGVNAYLELDRQLRHYRRMLSSYSHGRVHLGAVTPVISGDRAARVPMEAQRRRYAFYDGRLDDLGTAAPASFVPLISSNWTQSFTWLGTGPFPAAERQKLHAIVADAHGHGQRVRFWATPDVAGPARDAMWSELLAARVDHINTDDLAGLESFLRARGE